MGLACVHPILYGSHRQHLHRRKEQNLSSCSVSFKRSGCCLSTTGSIKREGTVRCMRLAPAETHASDANACCLRPQLVAAGSCKLQLLPACGSHIMAVKQIFEVPVQILQLGAEDPSGFIKGLLARLLLAV